MLVQAITSSTELAAVLNAQPATPADAAETPRDWIDGIWVAGTIYPLDPEATTETLAVLADGTAAVCLTEKGRWCAVNHGRGFAKGLPHWCVADADSWTWGQDVRGVTRDWRAVTVWDANGYTNTTVHPTLDAAKTAFDREVAQLRTESAPQVTEETVRELLAEPADHVLYVSLEAGCPKLYRQAEDLVPDQDAETVISRADLVDELGEDPRPEQIAAYLPDLQELVDAAAQQL